MLSISDCAIMYLQISLSYQLLVILMCLCIVLYTFMESQIKIYFNIPMQYKVSQNFKISGVFTSINSSIMIKKSLILKTSDTSFNLK